jgi:sugar phosphate isomerase/epimerase
VSGSFHPRIAVSNVSTYNWSIEQDVGFLREIGVGALGVFYSKAAADPAAALATLKGSGLAFSCVTAMAAGTNLIAPPGAGFSPALTVLKPSIDFAAALGGVNCYFITGVTPPRMPTDQAFDLFVAALPPVLEYAAEVGVPLAIEHNNAATRDMGFVQTLHDAVELSQATGIGICLEIQNCWIERHLPELFRANVDRFAVVQLSDYLIGETTQGNRRVLGDGSIPLEWLLGHLLDAGFGGYFELELLGPAIEAEGYRSAILRSVEWLDERLAKWGV